MVVIDPQRDIGVYLNPQSIVIRGIFVTHRHEDIVYGAKEFSVVSGTPVYISAFEDLEHTYGTSIRSRVSGGEDFSSFYACHGSCPL